MQNIKEAEDDNAEDIDDTTVKTAEEFTIYEIGAKDSDIATEIPNLKGNETDSKNTFQIPNLLPDEEYKKILCNLNDKQRKYHDNFTHIIKTQPHEQFFHFISGAGGVGKSTLLKIITQTALRFWIHELQHQPDDIFFLITAPTGKAAFNVGGQTIHSVFTIVFSLVKELTMKLSADKRNTLMFKLKQLKLLIIDEISMVSAQLFQIVNNRLQEIFENSKPFGGISVIVMGDFNQLPPVMHDPVYYPLRDSISTIANIENEIICISQLDRTFYMSELWSHFKILELTEIMRQKDDIQFANALNRLAIGQTTDEDNALFQSRELSSLNIPEHARCEHNINTMQTLLRGIKTI
ncbi:hypothetical protein ONE63_007327 [Megalurothrips usitatus]|uniref:ATP-dependent DNA helicase n=1 Tax=Megalurothrips usitatus TaxID=439358 RepID=A0AAV7XWM8_9NEOP|nr:hypothetical protein ONE63_007327 [Megalurothrips usitatus]